jgi:hypothetical protein
MGIRFGTVLFTARQVWDYSGYKGSPNTVRKQRPGNLPPNAVLAKLFGANLPYTHSPQPV